MRSTLSIVSVFFAVLLMSTNMSARAETPTDQAPGGPGGGGGVGVYIETSNLSAINAAIGAAQQIDPSATPTVTGSPE